MLVDEIVVRLTIFIRRAGYRAVGPDCDVEDVFQVVMARAWQLLPEFVDQGPGSFYRFTVSIARGILANRRAYLEAKGRGAVGHLESRFSGGGDRLGYDSRTSVASLVARREEIHTLDGALDTLDEDSRRIVELSILEGLSLSEVAATTGLKKSTVWDRLSRAMAELQRVAKSGPAK